MASNTFRNTQNINFKRLFFIYSLAGLSAISPYCISHANAASLDVQYEMRINYRDSDETIVPTLFPFPSSFLPVGQPSGQLETVDAGGHAEISLISLAGIWKISPQWTLQFKIDAIDLYDRNSTSDDHEIDLDAFVIRYGRAFSATRIPSENNGFIQLGKFKKFEQQRERRTESYGVVSTAFNRFEDSGIEAGFDLASGFYGRFSYTTGNPVFMRDPNALAGDNGTDDRRPPPPNNPDPDLKSGIVVLYDAEVEDFDLSSEPETGLGLGYRWNSTNKDQRFDMLAFYYKRELAEDRPLHGTFYGADLDLFELGDVPGAAAIRLDFSGNDKTETGLNAWFYSNNFALFAQYVDQEIANMDRDGFEIEISYTVDLPIAITPVIRYSELNNDFSGNPAYPAPSVWWDWRKVDYGVNIELSDHFRLILEYADNAFFRDGDWENNNELLVTLRWQGNRSF